MFSKEDMLKDDHNDEIGRLLKQIRKLTTFTKNKQDLVRDLINLGKKQKYIIFWGYTHRYFIGRVGQSFIYKVPKNKRGNLVKFKDKTIRVICIGSGVRFIRQYMAGII
tara:strand:+ start:243 stop:569 length:327 start_codon:yes stop_codon:yes gene_type:complete